LRRIILLALLLIPQTVHAFHSWQTESGQGEARGLFRLYGSAVENRSVTTPDSKKRDAGMAGVARLLMEGSSGGHLGYEVNLYQTWIPATLFSENGIQPDVERSSQLERSFSSDDYIHLALDRFNVRWSSGRTDLRVGRQAINLAATFYFTPNDFFAPFAAQTFYRVYKPGVDAARADIRVNDLSQFSLISVLGYGQDSAGDTGWSKGADSGRTSTLARLSAVYSDFEWAALIGRVRNKDIAGASLQGELFRWLGVRAEGHMAKPRESSLNSYTELSIGLEHRWENSIEARLELFYHGCGAKRVPDYSSAASGHCDSGYSARRYSAAGISYELTPLMFVQALLVSNQLDHSGIISFNATYSLSDESELALNIGLPYGEKPDAAASRSEFGGYPSSINLETRIYF